MAGKILLLVKDENGKALTHEYRKKKPKYTKFGEEPKRYECTKRKCKWQGLDSEREQKRTDPKYLMYESVCPNCGNNEFYGLTE